MSARLHCDNCGDVIADDQKFISISVCDPKSNLFEAVTTALGEDKDFCCPNCARVWLNVWLNVNAQAQTAAWKSSAEVEG